MKFSLSVSRVIFALAGAISLSLTWQNNGRSIPPQNSPIVQRTRPNSLTNNWYEYTAKDGSYRIKFPGKPEEQNLQIPNPLGPLTSVVPIYLDSQEQRIFMCTNLTTQVDPASFEVEKGLNSARDGAARMSNSTMISEKKITLEGLSGREIILESPEGVKTLMRLFIDEKGQTVSVYQILVSGSNESFDTPETRAFLDSFTVLK